jgi:succinate dehydrogenase flavin-adding protein (antitoxin of CptAB toxin-antitoxin module)
VTALIDKMQAIKRIIQRPNVVVRRLDFNIKNVSIKVSNSVGSGSLLPNGINKKGGEAMSDRQGGTNVNYLTDFVENVTDEDLQKIKSKDAMLRAKCDYLSATLTDAEVLDARKKRIIYRSKQRGFLEADLLLGSFSKTYVPDMNEQELDEMEFLLKEETLPLFNYICGKDPFPPHLSSLSVVPKLLMYADSSSIRTPECYAELKRQFNMI